MSAGNALLEVLHPKDRDALLGAAREVEHGIGAFLAEGGRPYHAVTFPIDSVTSVLTVLSDGRAIEAATVGFEGFAPFEALIDAPLPVNERVVVQVPGRALAVPIEDFLRAAASPSFRARLDRYASAYLSMMGQNVACNRAHPLEQRCARWVLMAQERARRDSFDMTQEYLAGMLGVTRPSVTVAAGMLQSAGFIEYHRGVMTVRDREGLLESACECYAIIAGAFRSALAPD